MNCAEEYGIDILGVDFPIIRRKLKNMWLKCIGFQWWCYSSTHWGETWCANVHVHASKMEDGKCGAQTRCHFSYFNSDFRLETDAQGRSCLEWLYAISNLTGSVLYCCWAACEIWRKMRERTWCDALTYIASKQRMRERILRCANERFPAPTNEHRLLASLL